jgi:hypothetical protein
MLAPDIRAHICGAIFVGGGYHIALKPDEVDPRDLETLKVAIGGYLENYAGAAPNITLGLLRSASQEHVASLPPMMFFTGEHEPKFFITIKNDFVSLLRSKGARNVTDVFNPGHNHLSATFALCSGEGEEWGNEVLRWMDWLRQTPGSKL